MRRMILWVGLFFLFAHLLGGSAYCVRLPLDMSIDEWRNSICIYRGSLEIPCDFGAQIPNRGKYHLGVDICTPAGTPVYSCAPGIVKSADNWLADGSYGGFCIIEHTFPNGEIYCGTYPHMDYSSMDSSWRGRIAGGEVIEVGEGEFLGRIGTEEQNGRWPDEHLHFGLRRGRYSEGWRCYLMASGWIENWPYFGYSTIGKNRCSDTEIAYTHEDMLADWCNPTEKIQPYLPHVDVSVWRHGSTACLLPNSEWIFNTSQTMVGEFTIKVIDPDGPYGPIGDPPYSIMLSILKPRLEDLNGNIVNGGDFVFVDDGTEAVKNNILLIEGEDYHFPLFGRAFSDLSPVKYKFAIRYEIEGEGISGKAFGKEIKVSQSGIDDGASQDNQGGLPVYDPPDTSDYDGGGGGSDGYIFDPMIWGYVNRCDYYSRPLVGDPLCFTIPTVYGGIPANYIWLFGEGENSVTKSGQTVTHSFSAVGIYTVWCFIYCEGNYYGKVRGEEWVYYPASPSYDISISASNGGSVSPLGIVELDRGEDLTIRASPLVNYALDKILVDNSPTYPSGAPYGLNNNSEFEFKNVGSNHTCKFVFVPLPHPGYIKIMAVPDPCGSLKIAALRQHPKENRPIVYFTTLPTGNLVNQIQFFNQEWEGKSMSFLPSLNGISVLGINRNTGEGKTEVRDITTGSAIFE